MRGGSHGVWRERTIATAMDWTMCVIQSRTERSNSSDVTLPGIASILRRKRGRKRMNHDGGRYQNLKILRSGRISS
ncbi:MAG: hypothetical protein ACTS43_01065 [Candidatus Hodgkinia cicadicola]